MEIRLYDNRIERGTPGHGINIGKCEHANFSGPPSCPRLSIVTELGYELHIEFDSADADFIRTKLNEFHDTTEKAKAKRALKKQPS